MKYTDTAINDADVPVAASRVFQHLVRTYASEVNKLNSVWHEFAADDLAFKPHPRASSVQQIIEHELLSERRFFAEFLGLPEVPANDVLPQDRTPESYAARMVELSRARLQFLAAQTEDWWLGVVPFFDVERERIWIFWRRVLHTAHHRAQLGVYLRMLDKSVPSIYGPTADVRWDGADPTNSVAAASRGFRK
ncbi:MAG TPA: DinB family protein [Pyrinomonadaceae bacterium]|nr:DinB family protein [Pyrinomonadaceae bacterium]